MLASNGCSYACNSRTAKGSPAMRRLSPFAVFAVVGQLILVASAWILPLVSEYRLVGDNISELAIGRYGFVQTLAFVISGLGVIGLASAIRRLTTGSRGSFVGSLLLGIYGLGALPSSRLTASTARLMSGLNPPRDGSTPSRRLSPTSVPSSACLF
jgi:hypothetical protein